MVTFDCLFKPINMLLKPVVLFLIIVRYVQKKLCTHQPFEQRMFKEYLKMKYKQAHMAHGIHGILNERAHSIILWRNKPAKQTQIQHKDAYHNGAIGMFAVMSRLGLVGREATTVTPALTRQKRCFYKGQVLTWAHIFVIN